VTQFLNLDWQTLINADAIERIKDAPRKGAHVQAVLRNGEVREISGDLDKIRKSLLPVVPATPGYFVVNCGEDEGKPWISRHQVVAWRIDDDRVIPVTPREDEFGCCDMVLAPDGSVTVPYDRVFDSEAEWAAEMASRRAEERRREAERRLTVVEGVGEASKGAA
jgi:hypothetical protein